MTGFSFRPLTGTLLSKLCTEKEMKRRDKEVSVPSRGLSYLNAIQVMLRN